MSWFGSRKRVQALERENARLREENAQLQARIAELQAGQVLERGSTRLREQNAQLQAGVAELEAENARLLGQLSAARKDSHNSSKPPSSDIVKAPGRLRQKRSRRRIGGQPGHPKHQRPLFPPEQVDRRVPYRLEHCPVDASHRIRPAEEPEHQRLLQQVELVDKPFRVVEHTAYSIWCEDCACYHQAPLPKAVVKAGLFGPRLTSLAVYLKGRIHASYSGIRDFLRDVLGVEVSRGYVAKLLHKASQAFAPAHGQLIELLPRQTILNIDETGHKDNGQRYWIWCFRGTDFVVFKIDRSRGTEVLMHILGEEFKGLLGCDYYAAYRKYARQCSVLVQFCLAHLIRDVKYLCEFPDPQVQRYGRRLFRGLRRLFGTLHRKEELSPEEFETELEAARVQIWRAAIPATPGPYHRLVWNMAERFAKHGEAYFQFITHPQIDPTNNVVYAARGITNVMPIAGLCRVECRDFGFSLENSDSRDGARGIIWQGGDERGLLTTARRPESSP